MSSDWKRSWRAAKRPLQYCDDCGSDTNRGLSRSALGMSSLSPELRPAADARGRDERGRRADFSARSARSAPCWDDDPLLGLRLLLARLTSDERDKDWVMLDKTLKVRDLLGRLPLDATRPACGGGGTFSSVSHCAEVVARTEYALAYDVSVDGSSATTTSPLPPLFRDEISRRFMSSGKAPSNVKGRNCYTG